MKKICYAKKCNVHPFSIPRPSELMDRNLILKQVLYQNTNNSEDATIVEAKEAIVLPTEREVLGSLPHPLTHSCPYCHKTP